MNCPARSIDRKLVYGYERGMYKQHQDTDSVGNESTSLFSPDMVPGISKAFTVSDNHWTGIYFLFDGNRLVYIGQSVNVVARIDGHKALKKLKFDSFRWIRCHIEDLDRLENYYVARFLPILENISIPQGPWQPFVTACKQVFQYHTLDKKKRDKCREKLLSFIIERHISSMNGLYWVPDFDELRRK